jgi:hypothetical protein
MSPKPMQQRVLSSALGFALVLSAGASARAAPQEIVFETRFAAAPGASTAELAPLPTVGLAAVGLVVTEGLAAQLGAAVAAQLERIPDGAQFEVLERRDMDRVRWVFAARTGSRDGYAPLVPVVNTQLFDCLRTLPDTSTELASMIALLAGLSLSTREQASASRAAAEILDAWEANQCSNTHEASVLLEQQHERILAATRGMLTGRFDGALFRGQNLLQLISTLNVLFFDRAGLWAKNREARLQQVFGAALQQAFLPADLGADWIAAQFDSFWSWVLAVAGLQPTLPAVILDTVAGACAPDLEQMRNPFELSKCVEQGELTLTAMRSGQVRVYSVEKGVGP